MACYAAGGAGKGAVSEVQQREGVRDTSTTKEDATLTTSRPPRLCLGRSQEGGMRGDVADDWHPSYRTPPYDETVSDPRARTKEVQEARAWRRWAGGWVGVMPGKIVSRSHSRSLKNK
ncbi:hypothetical protein E2C01_059561 [Portunus trituberculatus]|uniref:Uncharacterized protein n=1 Tax=Portunus trituberculatus TaxID=210409 RepID=A0A5B7H840_PORTR|nr:hypothetical protein [Portunus trituberculatus]